MCMYSNLTGLHSGSQRLLLHDHFCCALLNVQINATHRRNSTAVILKNRMLCRTISFHRTKATQRAARRINRSTKLLVPFGCLRCVTTSNNIWGGAPAQRFPQPQPACLQRCLPSFPRSRLPPLDASSSAAAGAGTVAAVGRGKPQKSYAPFNALAAAVPTKPNSPIGQRAPWPTGHS